MNRGNEASREAALEAVLARVLTPPQVPSGFRTRLLAAIAQAETGAMRAMASQWEREHRDGSPSSRPGICAFAAGPS